MDNTESKKGIVKLQVMLGDVSLALIFHNVASMFLWFGWSKRCRDGSGNGSIVFNMFEAFRSMPEQHPICIF